MKSLVVLFLGLMTPSLAFSQIEQKPDEAKPGKSRVVNFPSDRAIGRVHFFDPQSGEEDREMRRPAKGKIVVPAGKSLGLLFGDPNQKENAPADLSVLDQLGPNDLQMIGIPFQEITADSLKPLKRHRSLKHLGLGPLSKVTDETLAPLAEMTWLEGFSVSEAPITDAGLKHLSKLVKLKALYLSKTKITDAGLVHLKGMTKLKTLDLKNNNEITNQGLKHLEDLTELESFHFSSAKITGSGLIHLRKMKKLKSLDLMPIASGAHMEHLKPLAQLEWLRMAGDDIDDAALEQLTHLRELKTLLLYKTKVTDEGVKKLQKALPDCEIRWKEKP